MAKGSVHSPQGLRVWAGPTQAAAFSEACRRLAVMNQKWPETPWRMVVRKDRYRPGFVRHPRWAIYARIVP
jgi:hypothetical protein